MPAQPTVVIFDAANVAFSRASAGTRPDAAWLYTVVDAVLATLCPQRWVMVFDANVFGWLRREAGDTERARLAQDRRAGRLTVCPADTAADPYILHSARALDAAVVSNDLFRDHADLRVGIPTLRVADILGQPVLQGPLVYPDASAKAPVPFKAAPAPTQAASAPQPAPEPPTPADPRATLRAALDASDAEVMPLPKAVQVVRAALGQAAADALVRSLVDRKPGMWRTVFAQGVPGWRLDGEQLHRIPEGAADPTLDDLRGHIGALVDRGVTHPGELMTAARGHWGEALDALVFATVGGKKPGRWLRFLREAVPAVRVQGGHGAVQVIRPTEAGRPVDPAICAAIRQAAAELDAPLPQPAFVRRLQAALPPAVATVPTGFNSLSALLQAFPDVIRLDAQPKGRITVHPMPGAHPPALPTDGPADRATGGAADPDVAPPVDELSRRRAQHTAAGQGR